MRILPILLASAALTATANAASSEQDDSAWALLQASNGKAIYSTDSDIPSLIIGCSDAGKVSATISLDGNVESKLGLRSDRTRRVNGILTVGDGEPESSKWAYLPSRNMVSPIDNKFARRLYNAAVTGDIVSLDLGRRGVYEFTPPEINDHFKVFAAGCLAK